MDIWGIREELREIARRIATVGYACLLPDFYYRQGDDVHNERYGPTGAWCRCTGWTRTRNARSTSPG